MTQAPETDLLFLLYDVARLLRLRGDQSAKSTGMTRAQWIILVWLERRPGVTQNELAALVEVEPITVARLLDRLEARKLVERRHDIKDRRVWRLHVTPEAQPVLEIIRQYRKDLNPSITAGIDSEDLKHVVDALQIMKSNLINEKPQRAEAV